MISNSDPVTGQAAWYDVRVRIYPAGPDEEKATWPRFAAVPAAPGTAASTPMWQAFFAGKSPLSTKSRGAGGEEK